MRHGNLQVPILNDNGIRRENQWEIAVFLQVVRNFHIMESVFTLLRFLEQVEERPKRAKISPDGERLISP